MGVLMQWLVTDCGSDHELLIAKFRLKLKEGKTTRPFRYDLNQIPYDYIVEVRNRFNGLDLIDRVPEELWAEARDIVQEAEIKTIPKKKKCKVKMVVWGGLTNSCENKRSERQRRKGKIYPFEWRVPKNKAFFHNQCKELEENNRMGKTRDLFKKIEIPREHFMQKWAQ